MQLTLLYVIAKTIRLFTYLNAFRIILPAYLCNVLHKILIIKAFYSSSTTYTIYLDISTQTHKNCSIFNFTTKTLHYLPTYLYLHLHTYLHTYPTTLTQTLQANCTIYNFITTTLHYIQPTYTYILKHTYHTIPIQTLQAENKYSTLIITILHYHIHTYIIVHLIIFTHTRQLYLVKYSLITKSAVNNQPLAYNDILLLYSPVCSYQYIRVLTITLRLIKKKYFFTENNFYVLKPFITYKPTYFYTNFTIVFYPLKYYTLIYRFINSINKDKFYKTHRPLTCYIITTFYGIISRKITLHPLNYPPYFISLNQND